MAVGRSTNVMAWTRTVLAIERDQPRRDRVAERMVRCRAGSASGRSDGAWTPGVGAESAGRLGAQAGVDVLEHHRAAASLSPPTTASSSSSCSRSFWSRSSWLRTTSRPSRR